jgi:multiple sugar transport system substrate-binding protein
MRMKALYNKEGKFLLPMKMGPFLFMANNDIAYKTMGGCIKMKRTMVILLFSLVTAIVLAGCGSGGSAGAGGGADKPNDDNGKKRTASSFSTDPVTLNILASTTELDFDKMLIEPVKRKYPFITLNIIQKGKGNSIQELIASGQVPDLITDWTGGVSNKKQFDLFFDLTPLIKSHNLDLGRFQANTLDAIRAVADNNELYGLPFNSQLFLLLYNKDIFDKFGVPYPKDGMTWNETVELAKRLTRQDGGTQYRGLDPDGVERVALSLSQNIVDGKTDQPKVNNDQWKRVFELGKRMFSIPGNGMTKSPFNDFAVDRRLAMLATYNRFAQFKEPSETGLNWDVAQYPSFEGKPNTYGLSNPWMMLITKTSEHKDQAMQVLEVLTSDEVQLVNAREAAKLSPLKNPEMQKQFGADVPYLKGKHLEGIFKSQPAPAPAYSDFYSKGRSIVVKEFKEYLAGKKDVNTALRDAEESINQVIRDSK